MTHTAGVGVGGRGEKQSVSIDIHLNILGILISQALRPQSREHTDEPLKYPVIKSY